MSWCSTHGIMEPVLHYDSEKARLHLCWPCRLLHPAALRLCRDLIRLERVAPRHRCVAAYVQGLHRVCKLSFSQSQPPVPWCSVLGYVRAQLRQAEGLRDGHQMPAQTLGKARIRTYLRACVSADIKPCGNQCGSKIWEMQGRFRGLRKCGSMLPHQRVPVSS